MDVFVCYLSLADIVHCSRTKRQPDVLHLAGLQQVVTVAALLLQLGLDGCDLLLELSQLPGRRKTIFVAQLKRWWLYFMV